MTLPPSDCKDSVLSDGSSPGDGIIRMWMDSNFDNITSFTITSTNSYCFGLDNFYIHEEASPISETTTMLLFGYGLIGLEGFRRRFKKL